MHAPLVEQIVSLGSELNANQYKFVRLAAEYDTTLEWFQEGFKSPAVAIAQALDIHDSTAREWIRVGHALDGLPLVHDAFATNALSYAKTRILTRWADCENEAHLLDLAYDRTANRLTTAIASYLAGDETDDERDQRQHEHRSVTVYTDADGMVIIRAALPANIGTHVAEVLNTVIKQVAATPFDETSEGLSEEGGCVRGRSSTTRSGRINHVQRSKCVRGRTYGFIHRRPNDGGAAPPAERAVATFGR